VCESKPPPKKFLIEGFAEEQEMARMVPISLEYPADVLTFKSREKVISFEEFIPELSRRRVK